MRRLWPALAGSRTAPDGKTENSVRSLALDPITLDALRRHANQRSRPSSWGGRSWPLTMSGFPRSPLDGCDEQRLAFVPGDRS